MLLFHEKVILKAYHFAASFPMQRNQTAMMIMMSSRSHHQPKDPQHQHQNHRDPEHYHRRNDGEWTSNPETKVRSSLTPTTEARNPPPTDTPSV